MLIWCPRPKEVDQIQWVFSFWQGLGWHRFDICPPNLKTLATPMIHRHVSIKLKLKTEIEYGKTDKVSLSPSPFPSPPPLSLSLPHSLSLSLSLPLPFHELLQKLIYMSFTAGRLVSMTDPSGPAQPWPRRAPPPAPLPPSRPRPAMPSG